MGKMKILLFTEPTAKFLPMPMRLGFYFPNSGILSIAAYLEENNYDVKVVDVIALGLSWKDVVSLVKQEQPNVVGISGVTKNAYICMALAKIIKQAVPNVVTVLGGPHFSLVPEESLKLCKEVDYIIIEEGEITFLELIRNLEEGKKKKDMIEIAGLAYLIGDDYTKTSLRPLINNLDILPFPAYYLLPMEKYGLPLLGKDGIGCNFSRGCFYNCKFCAETTRWRGIWRGRSAQKIVDELELLVRRYNKKTFWFSDNDFMQDRERNIKFLDELEKRNLNIKFLLYTRTDTLITNRDLLKRLKEAGLIAVIVGVESFSQNNLNSWAKEEYVSDVERMAQYIHDAKIPILDCDLILGDYNDNKDTTADLLKASNRLKVDFFKLSLLTPWPGTKFFEEMKRKGRIKIWDYRQYDFDHAIMDTNNLSIQQLEKIHVKAVMAWWLNPFRIIKNIFNRERRALQFFQLRLITKSVMYFLLEKIRLRRKKIDGCCLVVEEIYAKHLDYLKVDKEKIPRTFKIWTCRE